MTTDTDTNFEIRNSTSLDIEGVPNLHEYFGLWMIEESFFQQAVQRVQGTDLLEHVRGSRAAGFNGLTGTVKVDTNPEPKSAGSSGRRGFMVEQGVAVIEVHGTLMKSVSSFEAGTSTVRLRQQIRSAARDPDIGAILLHIDSPGGSVSGTYDLVADIKAAGEKKPVQAFIEDLGASAAYAVASAAGKIYMNKTGLVGSIGTYMAIEDLSGMAEKLGVQVHVIKAGEFKGAGVPGTAVTEQQLGEWQRIVDQLNDFFIRTVSEGRKLSLKRTKELADGRVHIGSDAVDLQLIDGVQSFDVTFNQLAAKAQRRRDQMAIATIEQLEGLPGIDSLSNKEAFVLGQMRASATIEQARDALVQDLALELAANREEHSKKVAALEAEQKEREEAQAKERSRLKAEAEEAAKAAESVPGIRIDERSSGSETESDPIASWNQVVERFREKGLSQKDAVTAAHRANKQLHRDYLEAYNEQHGRKAVINF